MKYRHLDKLAKLIMDFNVDVLRALDKHQNVDSQTELLFGQLGRVMLAAGASYRWGRRATMKREFVNRLLVSHAEHEEAIHWLRMVASLNLAGDWQKYIAMGQKIDQVITASLHRAGVTERE
jgi:four helix bundle protein